MKRIILATLAAASLAACANTPKQPWGWVRVPVNKTVPPDVIPPKDAAIPAKAKEGGA